MEQTQDPTIDSAEAYYTPNRKRSFLFSRISVVASMLVLVIALVINVSLLSAQNKTATQSHASEEPSTKNLPSLPAGCGYQRVTKGFQVVCMTATPEPTNTTAINVQLPQLPPQCSLQTFEGGNKIICTTGVPIPTIAVTIPANCTTIAQANILSCRDKGQNIMNPLPVLPDGCNYKQAGQNYFVVCQSR